MTMMEILKEWTLRNRTIVSKDSEDFLNALHKEVPLRIHRFPSGEEYSTWVIPPRWEVKRATLSDGDNVLASYNDHPLFLAPYSKSFTGWVTRNVLLQHVRSTPDMPDVYLYEFRLAYNYQRRLKDWSISLPYSLVQTLNKERYYVDIEVETLPGEMLVGESLIQGRQEGILAFLGHSCHIGQTNDGLAGVVVGVEVMKRIKKEFPQSNFSYQLLVMPETIGSSAFLTSNTDLLDQYLGSVFIEMAGIASPIRLGLTRRGDTYLDRVLRAVIVERKIEFSESSFREHWGNDELVFDSPGIGVPGAAIERYPFRWYHTSGDNLEITHESSLEEIVQILMDVVGIFESDFIPQPRQNVPPYLTRYNLYADWENERSRHDLNGKVMELLWSGISVFDIAGYLDVSYSEIRDYVAKFLEHGLIDALPLSPCYCRRSWRAMREEINKN